MRSEKRACYLYVADALIIAKLNTFLVNLSMPSNYQQYLLGIRDYFVEIHAKLDSYCIYFKIYNITSDVLSFRKTACICI